MRVVPALDPFEQIAILASAFDLNRRCLSSSFSSEANTLSAMALS